VVITSRDSSELGFWIVYWSSDGLNVCRVAVHSNSRRLDGRACPKPSRSRSTTRVCQPVDYAPHGGCQLRTPRSVISRKCCRVSFLLFDDYSHRGPLADIAATSTNVRFQKQNGRRASDPFTVAGCQFLSRNVSTRCSRFESQNGFVVRYKQEYGGRCRD